MTHGECRESSTSQWDPSRPRGRAGRQQRQRVERGDKVEDHAEFDRLGQVFRAPRFWALFRTWQQEGDAVLTSDGDSRPRPDASEGYGNRIAFASPSRRPTEAAGEVAPPHPLIAAEANPANAIVVAWRIAFCARRQRREAPVRRERHGSPAHDRCGRRVQPVLAGLRTVTT